MAENMEGFTEEVPENEYEYMEEAGTEFVQEAPEVTAEIFDDPENPDDPDLNVKPKLPFEDTDPEPGTTPVDRAHMADMDKRLRYTRVNRLIGAESYMRTLERPKKKPEPEFEAEYVRRIAEDYDWEINTGKTIYLNSGSSSFNQKFTNANYHYVQLERGEFPILLYDTTVRNNAKYGFVLTNKFIHIHTRGIIPYKVRLRKVKKFIVDLGDSPDHWSYISVNQKGSKRTFPVFKSLDAVRVIEVADFFYKMLYHLMPLPLPGRPPLRVAMEINGSIPEDKNRENGVEPGILEMLRMIFRKIFLSEKNMEHKARFWKAMATDEQKQKGADDKNADAQPENAGAPPADDEGKKDKKGKKEKKEKPAKKEKKEKKKK